MVWHVIFPNTRAARRGFTLVELVVTMVVIGTLAAVAMPRFAGVDPFKSRGFHDEALTVVRFAQKSAIAWHRNVFVCVTATGISVGTGAACGTPIPNPVTRDGAALTTTAPSGVTLSILPAGNFSFDSLGRPSAASNITITLNSTIAGDPARTIVVEAETGYVHP